MKFVERIGSGGFGNVDLVVNANGENLARKTFSQNQPLDAQMLENVLKRFAKEVRIQKSITHPNIVPVLDGDLNSNPPCYFMPLAISSLADDIENDRSLGGNFVSALGDIVAGLEELHSMQIYHRNLKPENVLRFSGGGDVKENFYAISDFGLISLRESRLSVLTKTGMRKSSDYYTAPEITKDLRQASAQSDIYSLGCILHDIVGTEDRIPCAEIRESGDFSAILLGCTRKDPSQRFKSARALLDAILSVEFSPQTAPSAESINFIASLESATPPPLEFWGHLADFLEYDASLDDIGAICGKLGSDQISHLCASCPSSANRIGSVFAQWVKDASFNFDYCDPIANRLEDFFQHTSFETKVECLMAMLSMGTSHNRWFVERKFARLCAPDMEDNLAKRLAVHLRINEDVVCQMISHLEDSITYNRQYLHPALVKALKDVCP